MTFPKDPVMLLSVVNTLLRDRYADLNTLCADEDVSRPLLEQRLAAIGYVYEPEQNQFR